MSHGALMIRSMRLERKTALIGRELLKYQVAGLSVLAMVLWLLSLLSAS